MEPPEHLVDPLNGEILHKFLDFNSKRWSLDLRKGQACKGMLLSVTWRIYRKRRENLKVWRPVAKNSTAYQKNNFFIFPYLAKFVEKVEF